MRTPLGMSDSIDHIKNKKSFIRKMKLDKYWRKGFKAAKHGSPITENPYKLSEEIWALLRKRSKWILGYEEWERTYGKKQRLSEMKKERKKAKNELRKQEEKLERLREKRKHKKKKHGKRKRTKE